MALRESNVVGVRPPRSKKIISGSACWLIRGAATASASVILWSITLTITS